MSFVRPTGLSLIALFATLVFAALAVAQDKTETVPPGLKAGQTLAFYGDSITHHNHYVDYLTLFYATRYPDMPLTFHNAGVGGNTSASAMGRFRQDILVQDPDMVALFFGMNDGRRGRAYDEKILDAYKKNMGRLIERIETEAKAKVILLTPSMYDHHRHKSLADKPVDFSEEYNDRLVRLGDYLKQLGRAKDCPVIDLNAPMVAVTEAMRKKDKEATLSKEGVHPTPEGHFVMAYAILKGFDVAGDVGSVTVDVKSGKAQTQRAQVSNLKTTETGAEFDLLAESLPFPYPRDVRKMLPYVPFTKELNREVVRITGLPEGLYALTIDGKSVGAFSHESFAEGLEMARRTATPQYQQAEEVSKINDRLQALVHIHRDFRWMEKVRGYRQPDGTYRSDRTGVVIIDDAGEVVRVTGEQWLAKFNEMARKNAEALKEMPKLREALYKAAQPKTRRYVLTQAARRQP